ncbi:MAG: energy transducer TonB [Bacteroidota bacterium]|nr:energy transducer TonB [Bacteroidota bacterium]
MDFHPIPTRPGRLRLLRLLLLLPALLLAAARPAAAQRFDQYATDTSQVFSYVDQLPALPNGGDNVALIKVLQKQLQLPAEVREGRVEGRVFVRVVVGVSGVGRKAVVVQSLSPACDAAALAAVRHLPRLRPALYQGQPVAALLTLPVMFLSPRHVFAATEVARPASFAGGDAALEAWLLQHKATPAEVQQRDLQGHVTVRFVVKPDGRVGALEVINSLCPGCDDEALRLVHSFPRWQPAQGYDDQPVAQYQTLHVWFRPGPPPAGTVPPVPENQVYAQVEKMPTLPGYDDAAALQAAIQELMHYPERVTSGDTQVSFVVEPDGRVTRPALLSSLGTATDEAILDAVLRLPRFEPGRQHGQPVAVRLQVPVSIDIR